METRTLQDAILYFSDADRAFQYALNFRWEDGRVSCPRCGSEKHSFIKTRRIWFCYGCNKQFSLKVGTIFEDSPLGLDKWMMVMWMLANCKNGISSYEVSRSIGVTQRSAWFMLHRIRTVSTEVSGDKIGGNAPVGVDETFIGGKVKNMHKSKLKKNASYKGGQGKTIVLGMLERGGKIRTQIVEDRSKKQMQPPINDNVQLGAHLITDEMVTYPFIAQGSYTHEVINHCEG